MAYTPPADKLLHFAAGAFAALLPLLVLHHLAGVPQAWRWAAVVCVAAAVGREAYNSATGGALDPFDILATLAGGAVVLLATTAA